jgi:hypothetical protein
MTLTSPPFAIQASSHSAQLFREAVSSVLAPAGGIVQAQDFALTQNGTPNMSVNVGAGRIWLPGTSLATVNPGGGAYYPQGLYYGENDAAVNLAISASSPFNPRIDTVIAQVQDAAYAGAANSATLGVLTGTPTSGATLVNLTGAAAVPASSYVLGYVLVPANATTIVTADLSSTAGQLSLAGLGGGWVPITLTGSNWISGQASFGTYNPEARLIGTIVYLRGSIKNNSGSASGTVTIGPLPTSMRPQESVNVVTTMNANAAGVNVNVLTLGIGTDGNMTFSMSVQSVPNGGIIHLDGLSFSQS